MLIRRATIRDLPYIVEIGRDSFPYIDKPVEFFLKRLYQGHVLVSVIDDKVVGFVDYDVEGDTANLQGIAVDRGYRGLGIGETLLRRALEDMRMRGLRRVRLMTLKENTAARNLYRKLGFEETSVEGKIVYYTRHL